MWVEGSPTEEGVYAWWNDHGTIRVGRFIKGLFLNDWDYGDVLCQPIERAVTICFAKECVRHWRLPDEVLPMDDLKQYEDQWGTYGGRRKAP